MAQEFELGMLQGEVAINIPKETEQKLDTLQKAGKSFGGLLEKFTKGGGAALAGMAAVVTILTQSKGMSALMGVFKDILGLLGDVLFIALMPAIEPLFKMMGNVGKIIGEMSKEEGGILGAILDASWLAKLGAEIVAGILNSAAGLLQIGEEIFRGFTSMLQGEVSGPMAERFRESWRTIVDAWDNLWESGGSFYDSVTVFFGSLFSENAISDGLKIAFSFLGDIVLELWDIVGQLAWWAVKTLGNPGTWVKIGKWIIKGVLYMGEVLVEIGKKLAEGFWDYFTQWVPDVASAYESGKAGFELTFDAPSGKTVVLDAWARLKTGGGLLT